jgi:hypothetical protein
METVQQEGKRTVARDVEHYNLDAIISVGYRVNENHLPISIHWRRNSATWGLLPDLQRERPIIFFTRK